MDSTVLEATKIRINELEELLQEAEGNAVLYQQLWQELKAAKETYDILVMDSQGQGLQMLTDIPDQAPGKNPNYVAGVPVADNTRIPGVHSSSPVSARESEDREHGGAPSGPSAGAPFNLTIVVNPQEEKSMADLTSDIRIPLNMQAEMRKGKNIIGVEDEDKVRQLHEDEKKKKDAADLKAKEARKSLRESTPFFQAETQTLAKAKLGRDAQYALGQNGKQLAAAPAITSGNENDATANGYLERYGKCLKHLDQLFKDVVTKFGVAAVAKELGHYGEMRQCMAWALDQLRHKKPGAIAKAVTMTLCKSGTFVGGVEVSDGLPASTKEAYARVVHLWGEIAECEEKIQQGFDDPEEGMTIFKKLRGYYEDLMRATMASEGLGLKTEDMVRDEGDTRFKHTEYQFEPTAHTRQEKSFSRPSYKTPELVKGGAELVVVAEVLSKAQDKLIVR